MVKLMISKEGDSTISINLFSSFLTLIESTTLATTFLSILPSDFNVTAIDKLSNGL